MREMIIEDKLLQTVLSDLGLNVRFERGRSIPVKNCWHFSTDGNSVDTMFYDDVDCRLAMNRIYILSKQYRIVILAFCLMDNHIHFLLWGDYDECNRFIHDFMRRTSISISKRHGDQHKMEKVKVSIQEVEDDDYLKTVICYIIKNPPVAGLPFTSYDYPWSSGSLYFRTRGVWASARWLYENTNDDCVLSDGDILNIFGSRPHNMQSLKFSRSFAKIHGIVFPGEYVAYEIVERIFRTHKGFQFVMGRTKEKDVESVGSFFSYLTVPDREMRQSRDELCKELFGVASVRCLNVSQRIQLARALKSKYRSSIKQIIRLSGLKYEEVSSLL